MAARVANHSWTLLRFRIGAACVRRLSRTRGGLSLIRHLRQRRLTAPLYRALVGHHQVFASLHEASAAVAPYANQGHHNPANAELHLNLSQTARPSDYPALFHLRALLPALHRVFDLGGNVGNLFYCYSKYLELPQELEWQVHDLPSNLLRGAALAKECHAHRLRFSETWMDASGADLLLASGSLHYFEHPLPEMVAELPVRPRHILINRTPLTDGPPVAAVQEAGAFRVACMLYNRQTLIRDFKRLGYEMVDRWQVPELSLDIPGYPEHSVRAYSGFFLTHRDGSAIAGGSGP